MSEKMPGHEELKKIQDENMTDEQIRMSEEREGTFNAGRKDGLKEAYDASPEGRKEKELKVIEELCRDGHLMLAAKKDGKYIPISWEEVFDSGWDCVDAKDPELAFSVRSKLKLDYESGDCFMVFTKNDLENPVCADCNLGLFRKKRDSLK